MFKQFKTKAKIRLGFVLVLAFVAVFALYVIISNNSTIRNVDSIREETELRGMTLELSSKLQGIDVKNQTIILTFDEQVYQSGLADFADCESKAAEIIQYINATPGLEPLREAAEVTASEVTIYKKNYIALQESNNHLQDTIKRANIAEDELLSGCTGILDYQVELMRDEASKEVEASARLRRADRVETGFEIAERFMNVAASFNVIFASFDFTDYDESMAHLDDTIATLQAFVDESTLAYNIETGGKMLLSLTNFKNEVLAFKEANDACDVNITGSSNAAEKAQNALIDLSNGLRDMISDQVGATASMARSSLIFILAVSVLLIGVSIIISEILSNDISKPVNLMHSVIDQVGTYGDMEIPAETMNQMLAVSDGKDEVSQSISSFMNLIEHFSSISKDLSRMADGDLSIEVNLLSERDTIGNSMTEMLEKLNAMIGMAEESAREVHKGSKQISDSSSALAQGAAEQSASVDMLTNSIHEMAMQTTESAGMAKRAAEITTAIKDDAENGSMQMDSMVRAVKEINDASHSIDKVIGVIDDIAFQTNILALNASVEAARAGQHGKGFAVVAEEVRNLAAKSAEAARNTNALIADSIAKADYGARIAAETAASLKKIVGGINESTGLVNSIAGSSGAQARSISEIEENIGHVSSVVQQNSAAAEESAASSEEMSAQANVLEELVTRFKLKNRNRGGFHM